MNDDRGPAGAHTGPHPGALPPVGADEPPADDGWRRVHPATPLVKSWQAVALVVVFFGRDVGEAIARGDRDGIVSVVVDNGLIGAAIGVALLAAVVGWAYLGWRMIRYRVTAQALELHQGVLSRQHRLAPLDRLQAVDITEPLVARLFGLAKLTLEVAGGGSSKIEVGFLGEAQARALRAQLLAAAAGLAPAPATDGDAGTTEAREAPEAAEHDVITIPMARLVGSILLSGASILLALAIVAVAARAVVAGDVGIVALLVPVVLGAGGSMWNELTKGYGFRIAATDDGMRLRRGLFEQRTQTVPTGRVQAVRLRQRLLWRLTGWWTVEVNVAGYGVPSSSGSADSSLLLPVGTRAEALRLLGHILPGLDIGDADLVGRGDGGGFTSPPRRARWVAPVSWRRSGVRVAGPALVLRRGRLHRSLMVVPHARTQSCGVWQGPLQRRLGLATFELHSTPGPVKPFVEHLSSDVAAALLDEQAARARAARVSSRDD